MTADKSVSRIDAAREARMLVSTASHAPLTSHAVMDFTDMDPMVMHAEFLRVQQRYQTAPFDPDGKDLRFFPGGVSIWSGFPGSGKTTILRQLALHLMKRGEGVFFASLEEDPKFAFIGIAGVAGGIPLGETPPIWAIRGLKDQFADKLRIWGEVGIVTTRQMLGAIRALAQQGTTHAIIDSLMCLDVANDDINAQRQFALEVSATAKTTGCHIHLVAHPRKPMQRDQEPDQHDVAGAKELAGIADNVLFIRRNTERIGNIAGMKISVKKQRHWTGSLPDYEGWLHLNFRQYMPQQLADWPIRYLHADTYE